MSIHELGRIDAYWQASLYRCLGILYLRDNPLLREPLKLEHIKPWLLGRWGSDATVSWLLRAVPAAVPGVAFLSGGQSAELASARLNAMNVRWRSKAPCVLTFSFSRAIQQPALNIWRGQESNRAAAQKTLYHRA